MYLDNICYFARCYCIAITFNSIWPQMHDASRPVVRPQQKEITMSRTIQMTAPSAKAATRFKFLAVIAAVATLAACGDTDLERAATGAVIGGAAAAATNKDVTKGVLFGGAIGAVSCSVAPGVPNCY